MYQPVIIDTIIIIINIIISIIFIIAVIVTVTKIIIIIGLWLSSLSLSSSLLDNDYRHHRNHHHYGCQHSITSYFSFQPIRLNEITVKLPPDQNGTFSFISDFKLWWSVFKQLSWLGIFFSWRNFIPSFPHRSSVFTACWDEEWKVSFLVLLVHTNTSEFHIVLIFRHPLHWNFLLRITWVRKLLRASEQYIETERAQRQKAHRGKIRNIFFGGEGGGAGWTYLTAQGKAREHQVVLLSLSFSEIISSRQCWQTGCLYYWRIGS
jgi:hypothetical protein